jgi:CRISPR/Cas system-associated endonuclease Cas1
VIRYHHGLGEGLSYGNQTTSKSFLDYGKTLAKQIHFYSDSSSTLRFSPKIATEQIANQNTGLLAGYSLPFFMRKFIE